MTCLRALWALCLFLALSVPVLAAEPDLPYSPAAGETVTEVRPVITVQFPRDGSLRAETARFWIGGREASSGVLRSPLFASYQPLLPMPEGPVQVRFQVRRQDGSSLEREWTFTIQPRSRITSVTHDAPDLLVEFEQLRVEMVAEPGGKAWFEIPDLCEVPMKEVSEGVYQGSYQVKPRDYRLKTRVVGHLQFGPHESHLEAERPVTLFGHLFRVRILEPKTGSTVPLNFTIRGITRPHARISVIPKLGFQDGMSAPNREFGAASSQVGSIPAEADEKGEFQVEYGLPIKIPGMQCVLTIVATDQEGNRSVPAELRVKF